MDFRDFLCFVGVMRGILFGGPLGGSLWMISMLLYPS